MPSEARTLLEAISASVAHAFDSWTFRDISASISRDTHEVVFDIDLRNDSRDAQLGTIQTMMDKVYPLFERDGVDFTFIFSEHEEARSLAEARLELAVV